MNILFIGIGIIVCSFLCLIIKKHRWIACVLVLWVILFGTYLLFKPKGAEGTKNEQSTDEIVALAGKSFGGALVAGSIGYFIGMALSDRKSKKKKANPLSNMDAESGNEHSAQIVDPDEEIKQRVFKVIIETLSLRGLNPVIDENTSLHNLGADLLDWVQIELGLEEEFKFSFPKIQPNIADSPLARYFKINASLNEKNFNTTDIGTVALLIDAVKELLQSAGQENVQQEQSPTFVTEHSYVTSQKTGNETNNTTTTNVNNTAPQLDFGNWDMVFVEGSPFLATLGDTTDSGQEIVVNKNVDIQSFYIGRYPVTRGQWFSIMQDKLCEEDADLPIAGISWERSQEFIKKLNERTGKKFRLPTAAEWEYAASGGNQSKGYQFSGSNNADEVAWYGANSGGHSHKVGTKKPNELGIYDMSGNVWEWCHDRWGGFQKHPTYGGRQQLLMMKRIVTMTGNSAALEDIERKLTEPVVLDEGAYRVRRGCHWGIPTPYLHDSIRFTEVPNDGSAGNGFRLAHSQEKKQ